jgi:DNA-binding sugar fermentation-stimulating protein
MKVLLMVACLFVASASYGQTTVVTNPNTGKATVVHKGPNGVTTTSNASTAKTKNGVAVAQGPNGAAVVNPHTGNAAVAHTNSNGVTTTQTSNGGKAKTKNGMGVAQGPGGTTCVKGPRNQGCKK